MRTREPPPYPRPGPLWYVRGPLIRPGLLGKSQKNGTRARAARPERIKAETAELVLARVRQGVGRVRSWRDKAAGDHTDVVLRIGDILQDDEDDPDSGLTIVGEDQEGNDATLSHVGGEDLQRLRSDLDLWWAAMINNIVLLYF